MTRRRMTRCRGLARIRRVLIIGGRGCRCRPPGAVLFASVVDDPSEHPERFPTEEAQNAERERLFDIIRRMMGKKLHEHPEVYAEARAEMLKYCDGKIHHFRPVCGVGLIPLEANRLGFEAHAGDLNPVAVLLNKCISRPALRWVAALRSIPMTASASAVPMRGVARMG